LILAGGVTAALLLFGFLARRRGMPHRRTWQSRLARLYGPAAAQDLGERMQQIYEDLMARRPRYAHPVQRYHVAGQILPALALYQALREQAGDSKVALEQMEPLLWSTIGPLYCKALWPLRRLRNPFGLWRAMVRLAMRAIFPPAGWKRQVVVDSPSCYAFDIKGCMYLDVLRHFGAPELTRLFCRMDDLLAGLAPEQIGWQRRGTLALGYPCCDFRWHRIDHNVEPE